MTRKLLLFFLPVLAAVGIIGCGDDNPTVTVNPYLTYAVGDKFTYNYYQRDENNARVDSTKEVVVWTVTRIDLDTLNRGEVTEIEEVRYDATGQTETGRSKLYFRASGQGELFQYNLMPSVLERFSGGIDFSTYVDQIFSAPSWIQVSSTKDANARVLVDNPGLINMKLDNVTTASFTFDAQIKLGVRSNHLGKKSVTVPAQTYANAFSTDNNILVHVTTLDSINLGVTMIDSGSVLINDSATVHFDVDVEGGVLAESLASKQVLVAGVFPIQINGYEMELTAVQRAQVEEEED